MEAGSSAIATQHDGASIAAVLREVDGGRSILDTARNRNAFPAVGVLRVRPWRRMVGARCWETRIAVMSA